MSAVRVDYHPNASSELDDALGWYLERSPSAAAAFVREMERTISLIRSEPTIWPSYGGNTRRYVMPRFPFSVVYRLIDERIQVVALAHHKRRPDYWRGRLEG